MAKHTANPLSRSRRPLFHAAAALLLAGALCHAAGDVPAHIEIAKDFTTVEGVGEAPLHIEDKDLGPKIAKLLEKQVKMSAIEASLAADLSGRLDELTADLQDSFWEKLLDLQKASMGDVGAAARVAGRTAGYLFDEGPAVMRLYALCAYVGVRIDGVAAERHDLERSHFDYLAGNCPKCGRGLKALRSPEAPPVPEGIAAPPPSRKFQCSDHPKCSYTITTTGKWPPFLGLSEGQQDAVVDALRARVLSIRDYRQNKLENLLLARRDADDSSMPTATFERAVDLWYAGGAHIQKLQDELKQAQKRRRDLLIHRETQYTLLKSQEKALAALPGPPGSKEAQLAALRAALKAAEDDVAAQLAKIDKLKKDIHKEELGIDSEKGGVRKPEKFRQALEEFAATWSPKYAELAIRRRVFKRSTREADHLYTLAQQFSHFRRMQLAVRQRVAYGKDPKANKRLRGASIDLGLVTLAQRELQAEEAFLGQLDYAIRMFQAAKDLGATDLKRHLERLSTLADTLETMGDQNPSPETVQRLVAETRKELRFFIDEAEHLKALGGGAYQVFMEHMKTWANMIVSKVNRRPFYTQLDKTHREVRKARGKTGGQVDFLVEAIRKNDGELLAFLGLPKEPTLSTYEKFIAYKGKRPVLTTFHEDRSFYDALDGGLRRLATTLPTTRVGRLDWEYAIAYERGCYALRDVWQIQQIESGFDKKGDFSLKLFLSPMRALSALGRFLYRWCSKNPLGEGGKREFAIDKHVSYRKGQLRGMSDIYPLLRKGQYDWRRYFATSEEEEKKDKKRFIDHRELFRNQPQYRRFWHKVKQEDLADAQHALTRALEVAENWQVRLELQERLVGIGRMVPSPKLLARAHLEDAADFTQANQFAQAVEAMLHANELDPEVVSMARVAMLEENVAWWETGQKYA
ncbi:hypothetical protein HQ576_11395, partial [bacterium]|nr:hypothetical protein [bacterium]